MPKPPRTTPTKREIARVMAAMGAKGGKIGGKRRLETMTAYERQARARHAAQTRWAKRRRNED